ncbi:PTS fructose transporter subunit IIB [Natronoarchaeum rubrum]|uniref:PTS fructose transporter subunit IIB n=1 Tax=Natronoarchaeum rubrum TaxID=755311 RepID=UPI00211243F0|nr:PTS fructose transporter subunit IIB [Natronoarchaeum rubrum]
MKFVAVTACPTGIAHSQMAAENLETTAEERGHEIHVEVQGAMGTENEIPADAIAEADAVIIAADTSVPTDRFEGEVVVKGSVKDGVNDPDGLIDEAIERADGDAAAASSESTAAGAEDESDADADESAATETTAAGTSDDADDEPTADAGSRSADRSSSDGGLVARLKKLFS